MGQDEARAQADQENATGVSSGGQAAIPAPGPALVLSTSRMEVVWQDPALQATVPYPVGSDPDADQEEFDRLVEFWLAARGEVHRFLARHRSKGTRALARWEGQVGGLEYIQAQLAAGDEDRVLVLEGRRASRDARGALVIHGPPRDGQSPCGLAGPVEDWPPGHFHDSWDMVNCLGCREVRLLDHGFFPQNLGR